MPGFGCRGEVVRGLAFEVGTPIGVLASLALVGAALAAPSPSATGPTLPAIRLLIGSETPRVLDATPVLRLGSPEAFAAADALSRDDDPATCLAEAIYFEARSESLEGQEAVAQVVINRTRLAQYPPSVCGVVFEGRERVTGCQFSFVCDGSLGEPQDAVAWERARSVAKQALSGFEFKPMRSATHFHASWMTPYWSGGLTRIRQIGGHVFYR